MDDPIALVEPGRNGDIINILPLAKHLHDRGERVDFLIHPKFASLLDGVSYVRPVLLPFEDEHRPEEARVWAAARYPRVIVSKVWNNRYFDPRLPRVSRPRLTAWPAIPSCTASCRSSSIAGRPSAKRSWPSGISAAAARSSCTTSTACRVRSQWRNRFARWLRWQRFGATLVKMPADCERLYDLLGLYERADLLITTDTATLWLAHAVHIPTIVLHQTDTWFRAPLPPATVLHCTYDEALRSSARNRRRHAS